MIAITAASTPLARFNALPAAEAEHELLACCAAPAWAHEVAAGRPYPDGAAVDAANREYEQRFGHIFLISATGRSDRELLAAARWRLTHDEATERRVALEELRKIALSRLRSLDG